MSYQSNIYPQHPLDQYWSDKIYYKFDNNQIGEFIGKSGSNIKNLIYAMQYNHGIYVKIHVQRDGVVVCGTQYDVIRSIPLIREAIPESTDLKKGSVELAIHLKYIINSSLVKDKVQNYINNLGIKLVIELNETDDGNTYTFKFSHKDSAIIALVKSLISYEIYSLDNQVENESDYYPDDSGSWGDYSDDCGWGAGQNGETWGTDI